MKIRSRRRVINLGSGNDDGGKKDRAMRGVVEVVVQGQIEINLRGLCKGRWNNSESGAARSYKLANKRRPHNSASCNGYKWRFSSPPASSPSPLRSTYLELNEETEKERETIIDEKKIGKHRRDYRPIREAESIESFLFPNIRCFRSTFAWIFDRRARIFFFSDRRANVQMLVESFANKVYLWDASKLFPRIVMRSSSRK